MAASGSQIHNTIQKSTLENISGGLFSNNKTLNVNFNAPGRSSRRTRGYMPAASDKLFGRDQEIEDIVRLFTANLISSESKGARLARVFCQGNPVSLRSKCVRFALLGAGGQGKTALALKIMAHPALKRCYSRKNSVWVPCEEASSAALLLDVLFTSLAITKDTHSTIEDILDEVRKTSQPIILLLDNFETPWNAAGARGAVASILRDIAQFPHVALFITMRAAVAPCEEIDWEEMRIKALDPEASRQLYASIDHKSSDDAKLPELFEMLGHMALAVKLMARHGKLTGCTAEELISSYKDTGTSMLGGNNGSDSQNSVAVSICMSLQSSLVKGERDAGRLLSIIAMLPSGTTFDTLRRYWAAELENFDAAIQVLLEASLLERQSTTYFVLPVIRSYLLDPSRLSNDISALMVKAACNFLQKHRSITPGDHSFEDDMQARAIEEINLQAILLKTTEPEPGVIMSLYTLAWHQYRIIPRTEVIQHALKLLDNVRDQRPLLGLVLYCYATILCTLNHLDQSVEQYTLARETFVTASLKADAAWTLLDIADVSVRLDSSFNEIILIEQAEREIESIDKYGGSSGEKLKVRCRLRFGRAHSRHYNHSKAIEHLTKARYLCADLPFEGAECADLLSRAYHRLQQLDEAETWALLAMNEWKQIGGYLGNTLWFLGIIYISNGRYDQAIKWLKEGLEYSNTRGAEWNSADILVELGRAYMKKGKGEDARRLLSQALLNYSNLQGVEDDKIACQYYLDKLDNPSRVPTSKERIALWVTWHHEEIPRDE
ncbi:hypothetical protein C8J56DRAFT_1057181 [Mycena floridula]|nr:hypothetical protein C8J56DRAFT_1057181 [Mycena floridula]